MNILYSYIGPAHILENISLARPGKLVSSKKDVLEWIKKTNQKMDGSHCVTATFVVDQQHDLLISDRHDEHVACAGGNPVLSAGEITFEIDENKIEVVQITNQSTGYCPQPSSWLEVKKALDKANLKHPSSFTAEFQFRRCPECKTVNIIKEKYFYCAVCDSDLPENWNL